ncbi:unnamed protein product [Mytilus coruscus]|uniref:Uncharacterized protein n=1 Tax=Mytilus coruscus TaxID=42192 RepID=A0A6J8CK80_MYTCO|nr:unnamed protein product [Mytilus coruscus]
MAAMKEDEKISLNYQDGRKVVINIILCLTATAMVVAIKFLSTDFLRSWCRKTLGFRQSEETLDHYSISNAYTFVFLTLHKRGFQVDTSNENSESRCCTNSVQSDRDFPQEKLFKHITTNKSQNCSQNETLLDVRGGKPGEDIQESERTVEGILGFQHALFLAFFDYVQPATNSMTSYYYKATGTINLSVSDKRTIVLIDELFMFLCKLKCGLFEQDLAPDLMFMFQLLVEN